MPPYCSVFVYKLKLGLIARDLIWLKAFGYFEFALQNIEINYINL